LIVRLHGHRLGGHASVVSPCRCVGAEGRQRCSSAVLMVRRFEVPARVCYVRVGVGSAVSSRLLLSGREQVRDNELSWVSASQPGSFHIFNESQQFPANADFKPLSFLSVGTKQQSRLKYSQSLMSICLRLLVQHSFSRAQSNPSQIDTDTSTILHSFRQSQPFAEYTFLREQSDHRQVYAKSWVQPLLLHARLHERT
jgi:hypothetical protein